MTAEATRRYRERLKADPVRWDAYLAERREVSRKHHASRTPEQKEARKQRDRSTRLMRVYGITVEDYDALLATQDNKCAICQVGADENGRLLDVDHCHITGEVRGLLCVRCNSTIGKFNDDPVLLRRAVDYLERVC